MDVTFASFLTPIGLIVAAGLTTTFIQIIKTALPGIDARVSGALMAFIVTAVLYVLTATATGLANPDAALNVFAAWLACATAAMGIKAGADHVNAVTGG